MQAIVHRVYGPAELLELRDLPMPAAGDDDVLVRVRAASVNAADWHTMRGEPYAFRLIAGLRAPRTPVLGRAVAGVVEAVGWSVTQFRTGDEVLAETDSGGFAEYTLVPQTQLAPKPASLSFEDAATLPVAGTTALQGLRDHGRLRSRQRVLINGASGGVGTFAVQIARALGGQVTAVCSTSKVDLVRSLGTEEVIDYTSEDFTRSGRHWDLIVDNAGTHSLSDLRRALTPGGTLVPSGGEAGGRWIGGARRLVLASALSPFVSQNLRPFIATNRASDLIFLAELVATGQVTPVIERTYTLAEAPKAVDYVEQGHARGKVVITV